MRLEIVIPGPPVPKQRARAGRGKFYTPEATLRWAAHAKSCARAEVMRAGWKRPLAGAVEVVAIVVAPDHRPRDLDNTAGKALCDALNGVAWYDDRQVTRTDHVKATDEQAPGIYAAIVALDAWDDPTASETPQPIDGRATVCGWSSSPEHRAWLNMIARCTRPHHEAWANYGGRGIQVAPEWLGPDGWWRFLLHVGGRPGKGFDLDRIDNDGNYEPGNVRWATRAVNTRNKRTNVMVNVDGRSLTMSEAARAAGVSSELLSYRLRAGWTIEDAMSPVGAGRPRGAAATKARARRLAVGGVERTITEWASVTGQKADTIRARLARGWSDEEAVGFVLKKVTP